MIAEISVIIIYVIWVMCFHLSNVRKIEALESRIDELERTVYIVPRENNK